MDKIYSRVNWKNEPSTETPVNAENLNKMDSAIDTLDGRVVSLDSDKYVKPSGGIPKTDLASAVQTSLGKADSSVPNTRKVNGKALSADITINSTEIQHGDSNVGAEIDKIGNDATLSSSATGNPLKLSSTDAPLIDFKIDGFTHVSKNLFNKDSFLVVDTYYADGWQGDTTIKRKTISSIDQFWVTVLIDVEKYDNVTVSNYKSQGGVQSGCFDKDLNPIGTLYSSADNNRTWDTRGAKYLGIGTFKMNETPSDFATSQVEEGSTATPYEPYGMTSLGDQLGCVDLGDLNWQKSGNGYFDATISDSKENTKNAFIDGYSMDSVDNVYICKNDMTFAFNGHNIWIVNKACNTSQELKSAMKGQKLFFELADNATPSMYAVRVDESGKNLWDDSKANHYYYDYTNGNRAVYDSYLSMGYDLIPLKLGESITISYKSNLNIWGAFVVFNKDGIYKGQVSGFMDNEKKMTYTADDDVLVSTQLYRNPTITIGVDLFDIQLEKNTTSTDYVPFAGSQTVFIPTSQPLQNGDSITYHVDGSGVEHRKMGIDNLDDLDWHYGVYTLDTWGVRITNLKTNGHVFCEKYRNVPWGSVNNGEYAVTENIIIVNNGSNTEKPSGTFVYELATPTDTPLTADQASELKKLKTYTDETNISTDELASMDVTHYANNDNAEVVGDLQSQILDRDFVATETKMLGWNVPKDCHIQNSVSGNQFIQNVGRVDLGSLDWRPNGDETAFMVEIPNSKYKINGNTSMYYTKYALETNANITSGGMTNNTSRQVGDSLAIKDDYYTYRTQADAFRISIMGQYLYYELAQPITMQIDGNEAVDQVKADLINKEVVAPSSLPAFAWSDDVFSLPIPTKRAIYRLYDATQGTYGDVMKRNDGKVYCNVAITEKDFVYLNGINS